MGCGIFKCLGEILILKFWVFLFDFVPDSISGKEFQDTPELFHTAVRWLIAGMEQDLARHAENPPAP